MDNPSVEYEEWTRSKLVPLPKKGDLSDLNDCRGINLLDASSKIASMTLYVRQEIMEKINEHPIKFGTTPNMGCAVAVFSLKITL